jgi:hypothetical protein
VAASVGFSSDRCRCQRKDRQTRGGIKESKLATPSLPPRSTSPHTASCAGRLADELTQSGHPVSPRAVSTVLYGVGYSLQANRKTTEGKHHPDRAQFEYRDCSPTSARTSSSSAGSIFTSPRSPQQSRRNHSIVVDSVVRRGRHRQGMRATWAFGSCGARGRRRRGHRCRGSPARRLVGPLAAPRARGRISRPSGRWSGVRACCIVVRIPANVDLRHLRPSVKFTGVSLTPASDEDTVEAADGSRATYNVIVSASGGGSWLLSPPPPPSPTDTIPPAPPQKPAPGSLSCRARQRNRCRWRVIMRRAFAVDARKRCQGAPGQGP